MRQMGRSGKNRGAGRYEDRDRNSGRNSGSYHAGGRPKNQEGGRPKASGFSRERKGGRGRDTVRETEDLRREIPAEADGEEENENRIEGRNAVLEAFRSGRSVDKLYVQADLHEGIISTITREARKAGTIVSYVPKIRLDQMSETGRHQGVIAAVASYEYADISDILQNAKNSGEDPFIFLLDGIEDPHNLGAIIRTANLAGAHGVIITKHRAAGLTAVVAKASAGAINYTPVAKVTNLASAIEELKKQGLWFVCASMDGTPMYDLDLKGPIGIVIGNEGSGVSRLVREKCDYAASIPMKGDIDSLNASVAAGVLAYEVVRQRLGR